MLKEKRIGTALILIEDRCSVERINNILSQHSAIILARQGIPLRHKQIALISLVLEGTTDEIGSLTGQIGRINGVNVKSVLTKYSTFNEQ